MVAALFRFLLHEKQKFIDLCRPTDSETFVCKTVFISNAVW